MGLFGRELARSEVDLYGINTDDIVHEPVRAVVRPASGGPVFDHDPVVLLLPLSAVNLVRNSRTAPQYTRPLMDLIGLAADRALAGEEEARELRLRQLVDMDPQQLLDPVPEMQAAAGLGLGLAELAYQVDGSPDRTCVMRLVTTRDGTVLANVKGFMRGAPYITACGLLALLEHTARHADYEQVTVPAAAALVALANTYFEHRDGQTVSFSDATVLLDLVRAVALSADPIAALASDAPSP